MFAPALLLLSLMILPEAQAQAIEDFDLEDLLNQEIRAGEMGSFGQRLSEYGVKMEIHGYLSVEAEDFSMPWYTETDGQIWSFDLHHQALNFPVSLGEHVQAETQLEWEHAGQLFYVPLAQLDIQLAKPLIVRSGFFVVPVGAFNEYQDTDFLRKSAEQPRWTREVIPTLWSEVGVQLRGKLPFSNGGNVNYAVFVSNGLEQADDNPDDGVVPEGGSLSSMRFHNLDEANAKKATGGRLGLAPVEGLDLGISGYTGAYTVDGQRKLSILDADMALRRQALLVRAEAALTLQEITNSLLQKWGGYLLIAYRLSPMLEPYAWLEAVDLDDGSGTSRGWLGGVGIYPDPEEIPSLVLKIETSTLYSASGAVSGEGIAQLTVGF